MNNNFLKCVKRYALYYVEMIVLFLVLLIVAWGIPKGKSEEHIQNASGILNLEGVFPEYLLSPYYAGQDNYTDALMLNVVYNFNDTSLWKDIMEMEYEQTPNEDFIGINVLNKLSEKNNIDVQYARYWHGYVVYLKPLLALFEYTTIRKINLFLLVMLAIFGTFIISKNMGKHAGFVYLMGIFALNIIRVAYSVQYMACTVIALSLCILVSRKPNKYLAYMFFTGGITAYLDLLTTPLITLGMPGVIFLVYLIERNSNIVQSLKKIILGVISWTIAYGGCWVAKWGIASIVLKKNVLVDGMKNVLHRTGEVEGFSKSGEIIYALKSNVKFFWQNGHAKYFWIVGIIFMCYYILKNRKKIVRSGTLVLSVGFLVAPFVWYVIVANHSAIHAHFTQRNLVISVMAISALITLVREKDIFSNESQYLKEKKEVVNVKN